MASEIWEDSEATFYFYNLIYMQAPMLELVDKSDLKSDEQ